MKASVKTIAVNTCRVWAVVCLAGFTFSVASPVRAQSRDQGKTDRTAAPRRDSAGAPDRRSDGGQRTNPAPAQPRRNESAPNANPAPVRDRWNPPASVQDRRTGGQQTNPAPAPVRRDDGGQRTLPAQPIPRRLDGGQRTPIAITPAPDRRVNDGPQNSPAAQPDRRIGGEQHAAPAPYRPAGGSPGPVPDRQQDIQRRTPRLRITDRRLDTEVPANPASGNDVRPHAIKPSHPAPAAAKTPRRIFTMSEEGRQFANGARLRPAVRYSDHRVDTYFRDHVASYPYYAPTYNAVQVTFSPFRFYFGVCPPYIERTHVIVARPRVVYVEAPIYVDREWQGYHDVVYYLNRRVDDQWRNEPGLEDAVGSLTDAFVNGDIAELAELTDPDTEIAVFGEGQYQYSLESDDYLDMTRDFMRTAQTTGFDVYRVREKTDGVYQLFARHDYQSPDGDTRTVYLCIAMERIGGQWTITQIDTSPDRLDD